MTSASFLSLRNRVMPMLELAAAEYRMRVPKGYPHLTDAADRGLFGMQLDQHYAIWFSEDQGQTYVDFRWRDPRNDNQSTASREKFAGAPVVDRRPLDPAVTDPQLRNLIAELLSRYNFQPALIHMTDQ